MSRFDEIIDRRGTTSLKWDIKDGELPMWVADMDFLVAEPIRKAIQKRVDNGIYGYSIIPDEWYSSVSSWWERRHHFKMEEDHIIFSAGVVPTLSSVVRKLTTPAENVLVLTPVYNIFFNSIVNNGRKPLECPLAYQNGEYEIDWEAFEKAVSNPQTTMLIFCNPHNPVGKIWDRETLARVGALCKKYSVIVVSDEIHCDVTDPDKEYIPFASVNETCKEISVTAIAPSKCFNIAGLQTSAVYVPNDALFAKVNRGLNTDEVAEPNVFAIHAAIAAFNECEPWLEEFRAYVYDNKQYVKEVFEKELPMLHIVPSEATYLLWVDCSAITNSAEELASFIREKTGLWVSEGGQYGKTGETFLRINIACPKSRVIDGMERLVRGVKEYIVNYKV